MIKVWDNCWFYHTFILMAKTKLSKVILSPRINFLFWYRKCEIFTTFNLLYEDLLECVHKTRCSHVDLTLSESPLLLILFALHSKLSIFIATHHVEMTRVSEHSWVFLSTWDLLNHNIKATALWNIVVSLDLVSFLIEQLETKLSLWVITPDIHLSIFSFPGLLGCLYLLLLHGSLLSQDFFLDVLLMFWLNLNLIIRGYRQIKMLVMVFDVSLSISIYLLNKVYFSIFSISIICSCNMLSYIVIFTYTTRVIKLAAWMSVVMIFLAIISIKILIMMKVGIAPLFFLFCELPLLLNYLRDR
jgi:hypothetical protein